MSAMVRQSSLQQLEAVIERGIQTFVEVGLALMEVRDRKLYEEAGYANFEMYCYGRWGFSRVRGRQLIAAAETVQKLTDGNDVTIVTPPNELQTRAIAPLVKQDPDLAREVWRDVNEEAEREQKPVTAKAVRQAVQRATRTPEPDYVDADYEEIEPDPRLFDLKAAIQLLEPLYRDYDDVLAPMLRAHTAGLRNVLHRMQENS